ncbi:MAG TPA: non-ribosomal peptide synthase/polyketide synthase [Thermoanaerobaculia bacterium]
MPRSGDARPSCLHELFAARAARTPEAVAIVDGGASLSYRELARRSRRLARRLASLGVGPETLVGLAAERSAAALVGLLGILEAGGAYLPLDADLPGARLGLILRDSEARFLVAPARLAAAARRRVPGLRCVAPDAAAPGVAARPPAGAAPGNLAYAIYTSGSTGRPKAVLVEHRSAVSHTRSAARSYRLGTGDRVLQFASLAFDASVEEIFPALAQGATLVLFEPARLGSAAGFLQHVAMLRITVLPLPTAFWHQLVAAAVHDPPPPSLRLVIVGGEEASAARLGEWRRWLAGHGSGVRTVNTYGPTEGTVVATRWPLDREARRAVPIGRAIPGVATHVLGGDGRPLPRGVPGELFLGGAGVARGYLGRPRQTAASFVPDPFGAPPGSRLYRTGDRVREHAGRVLVFLGRLDDQVKVRGFRVEPREVEAALAGHPAVLETAVVLRQTAAGDRGLVAFWVPRRGAAPAPGELRRHLARVLPAHLVPASFVKLAALPRGTSGKVDRAALPSPPPPAVGSRPPATAAERTVAGLWRELLGVERIGRDDDVFELGAHSLLATRFASRLREVCALEIPLERLFDHPTVAAQAELLAAAADEDPIRPVARAGPLPLTAAQEAVWFIAQLAPDNPAYNTQDSLRFTGPLRLPALRAALDAVVRRHEVFRTTFPDAEGRPVQAVHPAWRVELPLIDLGRLPPRVRGRQEERVIGRWVRTRFALDRLPLTRWALVRLGAREHLLVHVEHHLVHDGWSYNLLLREIVELYAAAAAGRPSPLPAPAIQLADYASWQRRWLAGPQAARQLAFWTRTLAGAPAESALAGDRPRPPRPSFRGRLATSRLPEELSAALRACGRRHGATLFMTMLAAYLALVRRYTGQDDLVVGSALANRRRRETEPVIGMLVNVVALRAELAGDPTFEELLRRLRGVTVAAYAHQEVPFERVVRALKPQRPASHNPLFQLTFSFHDSPLPPLALPDLELEAVDVLPNGSARFDLGVIAIPHREQRVGLARGPRSAPGGIDLAWTYSTDLFDASTIARAAGHYRRLLEGALRDPGARICELPLLAPAQRHQILREWNDRAATLPLEACLHDLVADQARRTPDAVAVAAGRAQLSFRELDRRAGALARTLAARGAGPETRVSVAGERSLEMVVALVAVLKAGAAFVPIEPTDPEERRAFVLRDAEARWMPDGGAEAPLGADAAAPARAARPDNAAYVMYTSGSTGRPKGVVVTHRGIVNHLLWMRSRCPLGAGDRVLAKTPLGFDVAVREVFWPLACGARLLLARPGGHRDLPYLAAELAARAVTGVYFVASALPAFLTELGGGPCSLRWVICGGEALAAEHARRFHERLPGVRLFHFYGPTETTVTATGGCCDPGDRRLRVAVGRPAHGVRAHVLDAGMDAAPAGAAGELHLAGVQVARGYLGRPARTARSFVPDPFARHPGERLYRSGDLARHLAGGELEILGRRDAQVKVRGYRIEPGEVEAVLERHQGVRAAAVVARAHDLAACVAAAAPAPPASALRAFLARRLPDYMIPAAFVFVDDLPRTSGGKVDRRRAAIAAAAAPAAAAAAGGSPRTALEEMLAEVWGQVLGRERVGVHDDFFELGGHSLNAAEVVARVRRASGLELPLRLLFAAPTIAALAAELESVLRAAHGRRRADQGAVSRVARDRELPLSFAQRRLWFLHRMAPEIPLYTLAAAWTLAGPLDAAALAAAWAEIVRRHEVLRTIFRDDDGRPRQVVVAPGEAAALPRVDLTRLPARRRRREARRLATVEAARPFDLARGPLARLVLARQARDRHLLLLRLHHAVSDGASQGILCRELAALYESFAAGRGVPPLPELTVRYADYAAWQRERLRGEAADELLGYWRRQLAGLAALELPADRPRPPAASHRGGVVTFELPEDLTAGLRALGLAAGTSLFMTLLAAFMALLHRLTGQDDVAVGTAVANRDREELEGLIGLFVDTVVMRGRPTGELSFRDWLRRVRATALGAYAHRDLPFEKLVEELRTARRASTHPLFQVFFSLVARPAAGLELAGVTATALPVETGRSLFDLLLGMEDAGDRLTGRLSYDAELFDAASAERLVRRFRRLLADAVRAPETALGDLRMEEQPRLPRLRPGRGAGPEPLSYHQERLWFIDRFETGDVYDTSPVYHNLPLLLHLRGPVSAALIRVSLAALLRRHEALRTRVGVVGGRGVQVVDPAATVELTQAACHRLDEAVERALAEARRPFSLAGEAPIRAALLTAGDREALLLLTVHHVAADRRSLRVLAEELAAICRGRELAAPALQHRDFARWQRGLPEEALAPLRCYWRYQLRGGPRPLELPADRPRAAVHTWSAGRHTFVLGGELGGDDAFAALCSALVALLRRYTGRREIVVGTSEPCRGRRGLARLVGPVANLVALRCQAPEEASLRELSRLTAATIAAARRHRDMPFDLLVRELDPAKDMSRTALFDVLFEVVELPPALAMGAATATVLETNLGYGKYDLHLLLARRGDGYDGHAVYNADLCDPSTIERWMRHLRAAVRALAHNPEERVTDFALLSGAEERELLAAPDVAYPAEATIHGLVAAQAARAPERVALVDGERHLSYGELAARAGRLARRLRARGVGPETLVAVCLERSAATIAAVLGILEAGGAYLPIDPAYPAARRDYMARDAGVAHLVTASWLAGRPAPDVPDVLLVDREERPAPPAAPDRAPGRAATARDLAYCLYTSGSTGDPKGVLIEHRNVVRLLVNDAVPFAFGAGDVWTLLHSPSFDFSVWETFGALFHGGRLVIVAEEAAKDPPALLDLLARHRVTVLNQTPSAFGPLAAAARRRGFPRLALREVVFGGEALDPPRLAPWRAAYPAVRLVNMYGITETTVHVTFKEITEREIRLGASNVGVPLPTTTAHVMDARQRLQPVGVAGEICVGGAGVGRGYLRRDELTRQRFVDHPYRPGERLYRSGDLGRRLPGGDLVYLGRLDDQVQIRGFRVEPGEVESHLARHPAVVEAAVAARRVGDQPALVAYVVTGGDLPPGALREHLARSLPPHMVPGLFVRLDALPRSAGGKLDRRALPAPERAGPLRGRSRVAPRDAVEQVVVEIWEQVLGISGVGVHDNFFELGGHSLLATQVVARARDVLGIEASLRGLFERPTIAAWADEIEHALRRGAGLETPPLRPAADRPRELPLSFAQQRLWFLHQLEPASPAYNMPAAYDLAGGLEPAALWAALRAVVRRHEALRTTLPSAGGRPVQAIRSRPVLALPIVDLAALASPRRDAEAARLAAAEARRPFDLERGPLLRASLVRLGARRHLLLLTLHHVVSDGWSTGVLEGELSLLYPAPAAGRPSPLPALPVQYADFALWQRRWLAGAALERQLAFWRQELRGLEALELPADRPRPTRSSYRGAARDCELPAALAAELRRLSLTAGTSLYMTLLAAFFALLHRLCGRDVVVGSPIANRSHSATEGLIGFFVNMLAMRSQLAPGRRGRDFRTLLERVRRSALAAYAHQDLPFEKLVEELAPARDPSRHPLFQVTFALQNAPPGRLELPGIAATVLPQGTRSARFDLELHLWERGETLRGRFVYRTDLFDATTVARFARHFANLVAGAAADPASQLDALPLATRAERHQALAEWNDRARRYAGPATLPALFEAQAESTPEATAVAGDGLAVSYGELDRRAARLARRLRALGVAPETPVALLAERSPEVVTGLLGILKAGGAYLPLDPSYPIRRLASMVEDSRAPVLLAQAHLLERWGGALPPLVVVIEADAGPDGGGRLPRREIAAGNPAYVLYTSGSTGRPKGVVVSHAAIVNHMRWMQEELPLAAGDRVLQRTPLSFDASVWEFWAPLFAGARLVLASAAAARDPEALAAAVARHRITVLQVVPSLLRSLLEHDLARGRDLRRILCGGEALAAELVERYFAAGPAARLFNVYGPTEGTIHASFAACAPPAAGERVSAGRPIANARLYLLDAALRAVPARVTAELWVAGAGLARGYLGRPRLTAASFVPDPFGAAPGGRLYRSGDLARARPDGALELLGRRDLQVKVRGFRIEIEEVEAVLRRHPAVQEAVVAARAAAGEMRTGETRLTAYVVPRPGPRRAWAGEHVARWRNVYEDLYGRPGEAPNAGDAELDTTGWRSSFTGRPLAAPEMREWVDRTVERIRALGPRRVLEIGCGTGLLLWRLAARADRYVASDFSRAVLDSLAARLAGRAVPQVRLLERTADDWEGIEPGSFDVVILNSVAQYFPGLDYLRDVLAGALAAAAPGGAVFVGDVRSLPLHHAWCAAVELCQAPASLPPERLRERVQRRRRREEELVIDPAWFSALARELPGLPDVRVEPKWGACRNELTCFRYDVTLRRDGGAPPAESAPEISRAAWGRDVRSLDDVRRILDRQPALVLTAVPNARVSRELLLLDLLASPDGAGPTAGSLRETLAATAADGVDPEAFRALAGEHGYGVELSWAGARDDGAYDVLLTRPDVPPPALSPFPAAFPARAGGPLATDPLRDRTARRLVPRLRDHLRRRLPEPMVPASWVVAETLPLLPSGKIDRRSLPPPDSLRPELWTAFTPPRGEVEETLTAIWSQVLEVERIGAHDDFFELGGHSLLATQVVSRARRAFDVELPLRALFEAPTVARLAAVVAGLRREATPALPPLEPRPPDGVVPLSFAQRRLWFLHQLEPASAADNTAAAFELTGALDVAALAGALREIGRRHEVLRTTFGLAGGEPCQIVAPEPGFALGCVDFAALPEEACRCQARRLLAAVARRPFDLARGPLLHAVVLRRTPSSHVLLLALHHVVSDGWSQGVLYRELAALYAALAAGVPARLPPLPVQYADYALWERRWLRGEELAARLRYWRRQLAGLATVALPADRPRPAVRSDAGAVTRGRLSPRLAGALAGVGREAGATLFMTLLAAVMAMIRRLTSQLDVVVGSPVANRGRREVEGLIGFFVNMLVLRADLLGRPTFRALLRRVRDTALAAYAHQEVPFERLVEELRPERDLARHPLFQVSLATAEGPPPELALAGVVARRRSLASAGAVFSRFDLEIDVVAHAGALSYVLTYDPELFDRSTAARWARLFERLLEEAAADPDRRVADLDLLGPAERHQLVAEWNDSRTALAERTSIPALIAAQAGRTPDAVAVVGGGRALSYRELEARAGRLARELRRRGVGAETRVALELGRSPEMVIAVLAVLRAGGAYVPLDPAYPAARRAFMAEDSGALARVTGAGRGRAAASYPPLGDPDPRQIAYVIYTSGSTGRPKGVMVEHRSLANHTLSAVRGYGIGPGDRVWQHASLSFDASAEEIFPCLAAGATLVLPAGAVAGGAGELLGRLRRKRITVLDLPTAYWHELVADAAAGGAILPRSLRLLILGGEAASGERLRTWRRLAAAQGRAIRVVNSYGPTEATIVTTRRALGEEADAGDPPIGRPIANAAVHLLDARLRPVAIGVAGELCVAGAGVARGYLGRPRRTAEAFVPDPFAAASGRRLYRTGDLARRLADGTLSYLRRADEQVKIRGCRVEPGEVEAALRRHPDVRAAAVVAGHGAGGRRLVAYVVGRPWTGSDPVAAGPLREFLRERMPEFMVPAVFVPLESLPLTPAGKVDRRALPAPDGARPVTETPFVAPCDDLEQTVAAVWRGALGLAEIGAGDNFFDLGGHSLLLIQVRGELRRRLGREVPIVELFRYPTVAALAGYLGQPRAAAPAAPGRLRHSAASRLLAARRAHRAAPRQDQGSRG